MQLSLNPGLGKAFRSRRCAPAEWGVPGLLGGKANETSGGPSLLAGTSFSVALLMGCAILATAKSRTLGRLLVGREIWTSGPLAKPRTCFSLSIVVDGFTRYSVDFSEVAILVPRSR